jgi:hypothetical protein
VIRHRGCTDAGGDVVVTGEHIGDEGAQDIERCAVAERALDLGVPLDLIERDMAGAFDHDLDASAPGTFGEFAQGFEFGDLGGIGGVGQAAGAEAIADGECHVVFAEDVADVIPAFVHDVFLAVDEHPLGEERAASGDDADEAVFDVLEVSAADAGVDGEVVDALLGLMVE